MSALQDIVNYLQNNDIDYDRLEHAPVMTVEESSSIGAHQKSNPAKTLFLTNKKHSRFFIVLVPGSKRLDLKKLASALGEAKLTFANALELEHHLKTYQGAVSPLGAIFVTDSKNVSIVLDNELKKDEFVGFHPNDNSKTFEFSRTDFDKFIRTLDLELLLI